MVGGEGGGGGGGGEGGGGGGGGDGGGRRGDRGGGRDRLGATAEAIRWLRNKWRKQYCKKYNNLIVLIPYGGVYKEDEMIQITEATDEGIIIVCAAGDCGVDPREVYHFLNGSLSKQLWGRLIINQPQHNTQEMPQEIHEGNVVFPAALGIGLSVGVAGTGPKGREIDFSVNMHDLPESSCGIAAARIASLLSRLLCHINSILKNKVGLDAAAKNVVKYIIERDNKDLPVINTYVIRELLVNEGNGSHNSQLGYGDGERIIKSLLGIKKSSLLQKLANIVLKNHSLIKNENSERHMGHEANSDCPNHSAITINPLEREIEYHNLDGKDIKIVVIDQFGDHNRDGDTDNIFPLFQGLTCESGEKCADVSHGEKCAAILKMVSPKAFIHCADSTGGGMHGCFNISNDHETLRANLSIISLSLSNPSFRYEKCKPVNKAVMAGKIIVFAAGNTGQSQRNTIEYPGRIGNVIVVGGRDPYHNRVEYSPVGREMDFLAEARQLEGGTSYAAPVVAGYIALLLQFIKEEMEYDTVSAWFKPKNPDPNAGAGEYQWRDIPVFDAARNVYAMRALLRQLLVPKPQLHVHSETEGFGCLDFSMLFPYYNDACRDFVAQEAKLKIKDTLQKFYKQH